jgi:hypothetical protein
MSKTDKTPISFRYSAETRTMVALDQSSFHCDRLFRNNHVYSLIVHEERSRESQGHYFAVLKSAWSTLPEVYVQEFASPEALRKWVLIKTGHATFHDTVFETENDAKIMASFMRRRFEYSVFVVRDRVVREWIAMSQSKSAMDKNEFQQSKQDVLEYIAVHMLGTTIEELSSQAPVGEGDPAGDDRPEPPPNAYSEEF